MKAREPKPSAQKTKTGRRPRVHERLLAQQMAPDPREWEYTGECRDTGEGLRTYCACGTPIRYSFPIVRRRDGAILNIGSVCIEKTVPYLLENGADELAQHLQNAAEAHRRTQQDARKSEKDAQAEYECSSLRNFWGTLEIWRRGFKQGSKGRLPVYIYSTLPDLKPQSTPGRTAASWRNQVAQMYLNFRLWDAARTVVGESGERMPRPPACLWDRIPRIAVNRIKEIRESRAKYEAMKAYDPERINPTLKILDDLENALQGIQAEFEHLSRKA